MRHFLRFSLGGMEGIKGARSEQQSDRAENHHQHGLDLGGFEVQEVRFFIKNALCLYLKICFPLEREAYFQKNHENKWSESEKWSRKTLDGKCDGYACAVLVTCKSMKIENVLRTLGRKHFFEGDKFGVYFRFGFL